MRSLRPKKLVLFPEIGQVKSFLSLTCPHSRMCIILYVFIFNFKTQINKQTNKKQEYQKAKETKEEKI